jgi:hypothetical protein
MERSGEDPDASSFILQNILFAIDRQEKIEFLVFSRAEDEAQDNNLIVIEQQWAKLSQFDGKTTQEKEKFPHSPNSRFEITIIDWSLARTNDNVVRLATDLTPS